MTAYLAMVIITFLVSLILSIFNLIKGFYKMDEKGVYVIVSNASIVIHVSKLVVSSILWIISVPAILIYAAIKGASKVVLKNLNQNKGKK